MSDLEKGNELQGKNIVLLDNTNKVNLGESEAVKNEEALNSSVLSEYDTLDESVVATLKRDFTKMYHKLEYVLIPRTTASSSKQLRNWDLWGPLVLCVFLSIVLTFGREDNDQAKGMIFVTVFVIVWFGGLIVTLNSQFLGAKISIFQSICVLGYCLFPIDLAALLIKLMSFLPMIIKIVIAMGAFVWSSISSVGFMSQLVSPNKKILAAYPIFLFYLFLSWFILA